MSEELKLCPFCGGNEFTLSNVTIPLFVFDRIQIQCVGCRATLFGYSIDETYHDWNTRPIEDELRAELEKRTAGLHYANAVCMEMKHELDRLKEENHALDQINRDIQTAAAHLDEVSAELARRDEIIARLKEVGGWMYIAHDEKDIRECEDWRALMKELE